MRPDSSKYDREIIGPFTQRRVIMKFVRPTLDSIFGDVPDVDSAIPDEIAKER